MLSFLYAHYATDTLNRISNHPTNMYSDTLTLKRHVLFCYPRLWQTRGGSTEGRPTRGKMQMSGEGARTETTLSQLQADQALTGYISSNDLLLN